MSILPKNKYDLQRILDEFDFNIINNNTNKKPEIVFVFLNENNEFNLLEELDIQKLNESISDSISIFNNLIKYGVIPSLLAGTNIGYYAAILCSCSLKPDERINFLKNSIVEISQTRWPILLDSNLTVFYPYSITSTNILELVNSISFENSYIDQCLSLFNDFYKKHKEFTENFNKLMIFSKLNTLDIDKIMGSKRNLDQFLIIFGIRLCLEKILIRHSLKNILEKENFIVNDFIAFVIEDIVNEENLIKIFRQEIVDQCIIEIPYHTFEKLKIIKKSINQKPVSICRKNVPKKINFDDPLFGEKIIIHIGNNSNCVNHHNSIHLRKNDKFSLVEALSKLWQFGVDISWKKILRYRLSREEATAHLSF